MSYQHMRSVMAAIALGSLGLDGDRESHRPVAPTWSSAPRKQFSSGIGISVAHCDAQDGHTRTSATRENVDATAVQFDTSAGYAEWLAARGVEGLEHVTLSAEGAARMSTSGQYLFPARWKRFGRRPQPAVIMAFPLDDARVVSEATIRAMPGYDQYANKGLDMVILFLMIERMKAEHGMGDPWMQHIAQRQFSAPITWGFDEIDWLRGTSLYRAIMHQRNSLKEEWEHGGIRQASSELAKAAGLRSPTFEDLTWATAAFTLFAVPLADGKHVEENPHGSHTLQIVPGLEIFSPGTGSTTGPGAACHLDVDAAKQQLCVICPASKSGAPLRLAHGDEEMSVEQMLFQFGALHVDPSSEVLMIECPIPPVQDWDASIKRRFALLLENDLRPQLFLSRRQVAEIRRVTGKKAASASARQKRFEQMFPGGVRETITIFVMDEDQLEAQINGQKGDVGDNAVEGAETGTGEFVSATLAAAGMRMAVLTTVVRLLEVKQYSLESDEQGTGTLEADERLLMSINQEQQSTTAMPHSGPTSRQMAALRHRMEQKKLVQEYLDIYRAALKDEMEYMRSI